MLQDLDKSNAFLSDDRSMLFRLLIEFLVFVKTNLTFFIFLCNCFPNLFSLSLEIL